MSSNNLVYYNNDLTYYPLISLIVAVYNAEKHLEQCILSILGQSYVNFELIVIDGSSIDGSLALIEKYNISITHWLSEPDSGIYDAWNKGLQLARGNWIAFVGADDVLATDALLLYVNHIKSHPNRDRLEFISSLIELVTDDLTPVRVVGAQWEWSKFQVSMITWHVGCFHARHFFNKYGVFNSSYKVSGDYELLLRPREHLIASFVPVITAQMRIGGVSHRRLYQAITETYRAKIANGAIKPIQGHVLTYIDKIRVYLRSLTGWKW